MKFFIYAVLLISFLYSNNDFSNTEESVFGVNQEYIQTPNDSSQNENDDSLFQNIDEQAVENLEEVDNTFTEYILETQSEQKNIYLSYENYPNKIYKNQRFEIDVKVLITTSEYDKFEIRFINDLNMSVLNPKSTWVQSDENTFTNKYYFKAFSEDFKMPTFQVLLYKDNEVFEVAYLEPKATIFAQIGQDNKQFSNIIAENFTVEAYKSKQYNNNELITILDISAFKSNLEDFNLQGIEEQGFSNIKDDYPNQEMIYYAVLPIHMKSVEFNYFNTLSNKFVKIDIPVVLEDELVSTQTDLNPNNSNLLFYKKVTLCVSAFVLLILSAWKRRYFYIILLLINLIVLILYMIPNKQKLLSSKTKVYILPTNNSTIFYETQRERIIEVVMKRDNFVKIILTVGNKKIIGWIKEENIVKN